MLQNICYFYLSFWLWISAVCIFSFSEFQNVACICSFCAHAIVCDALTSDSYNFQQYICKKFMSFTSQGFYYLFMERVGGGTPDYGDLKWQNKKDQEMAQRSRTILPFI